MKKTDWIKARIIDKTHPKYGKVVNVRKVENKDKRFFASIFEIEHCTDIVMLSKTILILSTSMNLCL